jgi:hypothetical protein
MKYITPHQWLLIDKSERWSQLLKIQQLMSISVFKNWNWKWFDQRKFFFFIFWLKRKQRAWRPHKTSSVFKKFDRTSKDLNANRVSCSLLGKELYQSFKSWCENCLRNNRERSYWLSSKKKSFRFEMTDFDLRRYHTSFHDMSLRIRERFRLCLISYRLSIDDVIKLVW